MTEPPTEELLDLTVTVNGIPRHAKAPARRLLSDFLRHDLRLTGTHVGCEHGVCGACTVLVDGQPMRSCLMFAVTAQAHEITTVEGLGTIEAMGPVQQAFTECHGLQCGFCTPGFLTTITAYLEDHPHPTSEEAREAISGNLCRCTGYQNIVKSVLRAAEIRAERAAGNPPMTTQMFGAPVKRKEDPRLVTGGGRYLDDMGHGALAAAFVRSPHAHARIVDIDVGDAFEIDGLVGDLDPRGPARQGRRTAPPAHPAPHPDPRPHPVRARQGRGQLRRRGDRHGRRPRPLRRRGRLPADQGRLRAADPCRRDRQRPRRRSAGPRGRARQRRVPACSRRSATSTPPSPPPPTPSSSTSTSNAAPACRWRARASWPAGTPTRVSCASSPPPRPPPACAPRWPPSSTCRSPRSSASLPTWAAASASRSTTPGPRRS